MKIRNGFVSNSSSSSFIIMGKEIQPGTIDEKDISKGMIYAQGQFVDEGIDFFCITKEMYQTYMSKRTEDSLTFLKVYKKFASGDSISPHDIPVLDKNVCLFSIEVDNYSVDNIKSFIEKYVPIAKFPDTIIKKIEKIKMLKMEISQAGFDPVKLETET